MASDDDNNPWARKKTSKKRIEKKESKDPSEGLPATEGVEDFVSQIRDKIQQQTKNAFKNNPLGPIPFKKAKGSGRSGGGHNSGGGDDFFAQFFNKKTIILTIVGLFVFWMLSGVYIVQEGCHSVVLRFGKQHRIITAGLSYRFPWPIEVNIIKKVDVVNQINSSKTDQKGDEKTLVLTGDENMLHVNYSVFWKIKDLSQFLFINRDQELTIEAASESSIREVLGQTTARLALTSNREQIGQEAKDVLQRILDEYGLGVEITNFQLQMVEPPAEVIDAFNDMQASLIDANRLENEAQSYANSIIPRARGEAVSAVQSAKAHAETVLGKARGEASQFNAIYEAYKDKKEITMKRLYLEGMQKILSQIKNKTIIDDAISHNMLPHLSLDKKTSAK